MRVALLAADPTIEELMSELITYAGYEPIRGGPATGGGLLLASAPIAMMDVCLRTSFLSDCIAAAALAQTTLVFFGSSVTIGDLRTFAHGRDARYFGLPGGPAALKRVLDGARRALGTASADDQATPDGVGERLLATSSNRKRSQMLLAMAEMAKAQGRDLSGVRFELKDELRGRRAALRNSVMDYARVLRNAGLTCHRAIEIIADVLHSQEAPAEENVVGLVDAASRWVEQVYAAA